MSAIVEVFARRDLERGTPDVNLGKFELPAVPRVGELITPDEGWGGIRVERVWYDLSAGTACVEVGPDGTGELRSWLWDRKA